MEGLESPQVPAPALVRVAHQALVAHGVKGSVPGGDTDDGVSSSLASRPTDLQDTKMFTIRGNSFVKRLYQYLPHVETRGVSLLASDTVRALGYRVSPHDHLVVLLQHDVEGLVRGAPGVLQRLCCRHRR